MRYCFPVIVFINAKKGDRAKVRHIVYNAIQVSLVVSEFKIFDLLSLLECVLHRHGTCTTSYFYYLVVPNVENYRQHSFRILHAKISEAPTLTRPFCQL